MTFEMASDDQENQFRALLARVPPEEYDEVLALLADITAAIRSTHIGPPSPPSRTPRQCYPFRNGKTP